MKTYLQVFHAVKSTIMMKFIFDMKNKIHKSSQKQSKRNLQHWSSQH